MVWYGIGWNKGIFTRNLNTFLFLSFIYKLTEDVDTVSLRLSIRKWNASVLFPFQRNWGNRMGENEYKFYVLTFFVVQWRLWTTNENPTCCPKPKAKKLHYFSLKKKELKKSTESIYLNWMVINSSWWLLAVIHKRL